jgi:hypothetical protein
MASRTNTQAGTIMSPVLLLASGVGPKADLESLGIECTCPRVLEGVVMFEDVIGSYTTCFGLKLCDVIRAVAEIVVRCHPSHTCFGLKPASMHCAIQ